VFLIHIILSWAAQGPDTIDGRIAATAEGRFTFFVAPSESAPRNFGLRFPWVERVDVNALAGP
jgi:hypothetical protein